MGKGKKGLNVKKKLPSNIDTLVSPALLQRRLSMRALPSSVSVVCVVYCLDSEGKLGGETKGVSNGKHAAGCGICAVRAHSHPGRSHLALPEQEIG